MSEYIIDWVENLVIDTFSKNSLREEIVRCKDCAKWSYFDDDDGLRYGECAEFTAKVDIGCGHATRETGSAHGASAGMKMRQDRMFSWAI